MEPFIVILIIVLGIAIAFIAFDITFVVSFNIIFRKHKKAIVVLLNVKCDYVKEIYDTLKDNNIEIDSKTLHLASSMQRNDLNEPGTKEFEKCFTLLTSLTNNLQSKVKKEKLVNRFENLGPAIENIAASEKQFRRIATMYNADCLGYNYWISFLPTRFIWKILKFKKRNLIEL